MIAAGRRNKLVTIEQATTSKDSYNQDVETWATLVADIWAAIEPVRGREFFAARQISSEVTHKITISYRSGLSSKVRVKYQSRYFRVESIIDPAEAHEDMELMCVEVLS
jgi:SPP1 family predicted phage head-tail adaptor